MCRGIWRGAAKVTCTACLQIFWAPAHSIPCHATQQADHTQHYSASFFTCLRPMLAFIRDLPVHHRQGRCQSLSVRLFSDDVNFSFNRCFRGQSLLLCLNLKIFPLSTLSVTTYSGCLVQFIQIPTVSASALTTTLPLTSGAELGRELPGPCTPSKPSRRAGAEFTGLSGATLEVFLEKRFPIVVFNQLLF